MFSGIIQNTGTVTSIVQSGSTKRLQISSGISVSLQIDQSIAHDGICLTVTQIEHESHWVDVVKETLSKTTFAQLRLGQVINLEKSLTLSTLLDGHLVQGHVDTTLQCVERRDENGSWNLKFNLPSRICQPGDTSRFDLYQWCQPNDSNTL
jgi:riboflavin synthase